MRRPLIALTAIALFFGTNAVADGHGGNPAVKARNAIMGLYSFNLGAAATQLAALAAFDQTSYWVEGTAQGQVEGSRAKAEIWTDAAGWGEKLELMKTGSASLAAVAGDGLDALKAGMGAAGKGCGDCHKAYRGPRN